MNLLGQTGCEEGGRMEGKQSQVSVCGNCDSVDEIELSNNPEEVKIRSKKRKEKKIYIQHQRG